MLDEKVRYRISMAKKETFGIIRLVSYSDEPVDGVGVGTIIKATDAISGDIFCESHVLITEYERGGVLIFSLDSYNIVSQRHHSQQEVGSEPDSLDTSGRALRDL